MSRKVIIPTIALVAILGAITMGTMPVSAQSNVYDNLVTKIAQRFNLNENDVQEVINQVKTDRMTAFQANWDQKLTQLVTDGKITQAQKDAIVAKHNELQTKMKDFKSLSSEERKTKMKQISDDLQKWAIDNKIDLKQVGLFGLRGGFVKGFHFGSRSGKNS